MGWKRAEIGVKGLVLHEDPLDGKGQGGPGKEVTSCTSRCYLSKNLYSMNKFEWTIIGRSIQPQSKHTTSVFPIGQPEQVESLVRKQQAHLENGDPARSFLLRTTMLTTALQVPSRVRIIKRRPFTATMGSSSSREAPEPSCPSPRPRNSAKEAG